MSERPIPISQVLVDDEIRQAVLAVLDSGQLAQGPVVAALEAEFAALCGVPHAIAVSSGTTALVASLEVLRLEPGDEVITSPFTFAATLNAILEAGATARFTDIDPVDFTVDVDQLEATLTDRTRVVMPVDLYGQPAAMDRIADIARRHGARVVEDAAQAHGAQVADRATGSFDIGCFSLYATKNVSAGEGGVITTDDDAVAEQLRILRNQGMRERYEYVMAGHNYRLTDLQAAVALPQIRRLAETTQRRQGNADGLCERLADIPGIVLPTVRPGRTHVFHQFTIRVTPEFPLSRDELVGALAARGIGTGVYYPRVVFDHDCYHSHPQVLEAPVPEAVRAAGEVLSLPVHPHLSPNDLDRIADAIKRAGG
jgi:dTDP-4-amino-4,6-dideoxygalactose transaminase